MKLSASRVVISLLLLALAGVHGSSQDEPRPAPKLPEWRSVTPSLDFLARRLSGEDANSYEFSCLDLMQEFARRAQVSVRYDARQLSTVPKLSVVGAKDAAQRPLFELCQKSLAQATMTLMPEAGQARAFQVVASYSVAESAPVVPEAELPARSPSEWCAVAVTLKGNNSTAVVSLLREVLTRQGGTITVSQDGSVIVLVDQAANLARILPLVREADVLKAIPRMVEYQRAAKVRLDELAKTLQAFLARYCDEMKLRRDSAYLNWEPNTRLLIGIVPQSLAPFLDSAVDAAERAATQEEEARKAGASSYVIFELSVPQGVNAAKVHASLRALYQQEVTLFDLYTLLKDEQGTALLIRCRNWLEAGVRDAFEQLAR